MANKTYKIIDALTTWGEISDNAKHRIGRTGKIQSLVVGEGLKFIYEATGLILTTSDVENYEFFDDVVKVYTRNTVYILKEITI